MIIKKTYPDNSVATFELLEPEIMEEVIES